MERKDSLNDIYKIINILSTVEKLILIISSLINIIIIFYSIKIFIILLTILCLLYFIVYISKEILFYYAEDSRIVNCIENAFEEKIDSDVETYLYYNNEMQKKGNNRLAMNVFESIFTTWNIIKVRNWIEVFLYPILIVLYILIIVIVPNQLILVITQILFSGSFALNIYKNIFYNVSVLKIYKKMDQLFCSKRINEKESIAEQLAITFSYEKLKSYCVILLSSKIFYKKREELSKKWEEYKNKYLLNKKTLKQK